MRFLPIWLLVAFLYHQGNAQEISYTEKYRPQLHFSPKAHWMNDPNGMVYYKGEYHLFYQYYPDSTVWGPMHWGHATSKDLIHWKHQPVALYPDSLGYIFSGSVVVDENNTSGLQKGEEKPLVALFTYHNMQGEKSGRNDFQTQGLAYSLDRGRTWLKYPRNPVLQNTGTKDFRDPKVSWHQETHSWIMTLAAGDEIRFYRSPNLLNWELSGTFGKQEGSHGGVWECPDLFPLPVGKEGKKKWVLLVSIGNGAPNGGSGTQYFIGDFDGNTFHNSHPPSDSLWLDYGTDNYAGVTWSHAPDNRTIFLGWMSNWQYAQTVPTHPWRSAMTLPRELSLQETKEGIRLFSQPVTEIKKIRGPAQQLTLPKLEKYSVSTGELLLDFDLKHSTASSFGIELYNSKQESIRIGYNKSSNQWYTDRTHAGITGFSKPFPAKHTAPRLNGRDRLSMHIFIDHSSIELFADGGSVVMTDIFFPSEKFRHIRLFVENGKAGLVKATYYPLTSIWKP